MFFVIYVVIVTNLRTNIVKYLSMFVNFYGARMGLSSFSLRLIVINGEKKCLEIYSQMLFYHKFNTKEIDKERNVIFEEMNRMNDNSNHFFLQDFL